jgi:creatinine amidohydrolase
MPDSTSENPAAWGCYERLLPAEIEAIEDQHSLVFLPWGALEYHGKHAAVGLDGLKAHALCRALAASVGGLVFPPIYLAANTIKTAPDLNFPRHSLDFSESTVRCLAQEHFDQLAHEGYQIVFTLCGHVGQPHYDIIKAEAAAAAQRHPATKFVATSETDLVSPELFIVNHAALGEVALLMASDPDCVKLDRLPADRIPSLETDAVWGPDPRDASAEKGAIYTAAFVAAARELLLPLLSPSS